MGRQRLIEPERKKKKEPDPFIPYDPRCEQCYYWRYLGGIHDTAIMCCHFALIEGKLRDKISRTECGSFKEKKGNIRRGIRFEPVPMSQWGCSGLGHIRKGER